MVRTEQVTKAGPDVARIPDAGPKRPRSMPWLVGALVIMTLGFLALAGLTFYQHHARTDAERLAAEVATAWGSAAPAGLGGVYDRHAVLIDAQGTRSTGIKSIVAAAKDRGPNFTMTQLGDVASTPDGAFATFAYRFAGDGRGSGMAVMKIDAGKVVRQWNFESTIARPSK